MPPPLGFAKGGINFSRGGGVKYPVQYFNINRTINIIIIIKFK